MDGSLPFSEVNQAERACSLEIVQLVNVALLVGTFFCEASA